MLYKIKFLLKKILGNKFINLLKLFYTYILFNFNKYNLKKLIQKIYFINFQENLLKLINSMTLKKIIKICFTHQINLKLSVL